MINRWTLLLPRCCCYISMLLISFASLTSYAATRTTPATTGVSPLTSTPLYTPTPSHPYNTAGPPNNPSYSSSSAYNSNKNRRRRAAGNQRLTVDDCLTSLAWLPITAAQDTRRPALVSSQGKWRCEFQVTIAAPDSRHILQLNLTTFNTLTDMRDFSAGKALQLQERKRGIVYNFITGGDTTTTTTTTTTGNNNNNINNNNNNNTTSISETDWNKTSSRTDFETGETKTGSVKQLPNGTKGGAASLNGQREKSNSLSSSSSSSQHDIGEQVVNNNNNNTNTNSDIHREFSKENSQSVSGDDSYDVIEDKKPIDDNDDKSNDDDVKTNHGESVRKHKRVGVLWRHGRYNKRKPVNSLGDPLRAGTRSDSSFSDSRSSSYSGGHLGTQCGDKLIIQGSSATKTSSSSSKEKPQVLCLAKGGNPLVYHYQSELQVTLIWDPHTCAYFALAYRMVPAQVVTCSHWCGEARLCLLKGQICDHHRDCHNGSDEDRQKCVGSTGPEQSRAESESEISNSHMVIVAVSIGVCVVVLMLVPAALMLHFKCRSNIRQQQDSLLQQQQRTHSLSSEMYQSPSNSVQESGSHQYDQRSSLLQDQQQLDHQQQQPADTLNLFHGSSRRQHSLPTPTLEEETAAPTTIQFSSLPERSPLNIQHVVPPSDTISHPNLRDSRQYERDHHLSYPHRIPLSRDGEEGFLAYQLALRSNSHSLIHQQGIRPPPNKTVFDRTSPPPPYTPNPPGSKSLDSILPTKHGGNAYRTGQTCDSSGKSSANNNSNNCSNSQPSSKVIRCHSMSCHLPASIQQGCPSLRSAALPPDYTQVAAAFPPNLAGTGPISSLANTGVATGGTAMPHRRHQHPDAFSHLVTVSSATATSTAPAIPASSSDEANITLNQQHSPSKTYDTPLCHHAPPPSYNAGYLKSNLSFTLPPPPSSSNTTINAPPPSYNMCRPIPPPPSNNTLCNPSSSSDTINPTHGVVHPPHSFGACISTTKMITNASPPALPDSSASIFVCTKSSPSICPCPNNHVSVTSFPATSSSCSDKTNAPSLSGQNIISNSSNQQSDCSSAYPPPSSSSSSSSSPFIQLQTLLPYTSAPQPPSSSQPFINHPTQFTYNSGSTIIPKLDCSSLDATRQAGDCGLGAHTSRQTLSPCEETFTNIYSPHNNNNNSRHFNTEDNGNRSANALYNKQLCPANYPSVLCDNRDCTKPANMEASVYSSSLPTTASSSTPPSQQHHHLHHHQYHHPHHHPQQSFHQPPYQAQQQHHHQHLTASSAQDSVGQDISRMSLSLPPSPSSPQSSSPSPSQSPSPLLPPPSSSSPSSSSTHSPIVRIGTTTTDNRQEDVSNFKLLENNNENVFHHHHHHHPHHHHLHHHPHHQAVEHNNKPADNTSKSLDSNGNNTSLSLPSRGQDNTTTTTTTSTTTTTPGLVVACLPLIADNDTTTITPTTTPTTNAYNKLCDSSNNCNNIIISSSSSSVCVNTSSDSSDNNVCGDNNN